MRDRHALVASLLVLALAAAATHLVAWARTPEVRPDRLEADGRARVDAGQQTAPPLARSGSVRQETRTPAEERKERAMATARARVAHLPPDVQERLVQEAFGLTGYDYCEKNVTLGNFYECGCVAVTLLEERLAQGPDVPFAAMMMNENRLFRECVSPPAITRYVRRMCLPGLAIRQPRPNEQEAEAWCDCTAEHVVDAFSNEPRGNMHFIQTLLTQGLTDCWPEHLKP